MQGFEHGFTLIELMVVIGLIAIGFALAMPSFGEIRQNSRMISATNDLVSMMQYARGEAIKTRSNVSICRSLGGAACGGGAAGTWEFGWIIFRDANFNGVVDAGEAIVSRHSPLPTGVTLRGAGAVLNRVTFGSRGYAVGFNGTLRFCDARGVSGSRTVVIASSGRIRRGGKGTAAACP